jgi:hypothetical protein
MRLYYLLPILFICAVLICGCTGNIQDEEFRQLVSKVSVDFTVQKDLITRPNAALVPDQVREWRAAASSAIAAAESMTLSDKSSKARGILIEGMKATITAVDTLEKEGKLADPEERVSTASVNSYLITTQTKIGDTCDLLGIEREKTY